jgi:uncharacterized 2Fe-2S/4Fe-4S cluster protein (DUF4445 family)
MMVQPGMDMTDRVQIELLPLGKVLQVERGLPLQEILFTEGVEFPCGGKGICKGCRIRILEGTLSVSQEDRQELTAEEIEDGWRLACRAAAISDLKIELAQWEASILEDHSAFHFVAQEGYGIAVDLGTTTIVAQLVSMKTGEVLGVKSALNEQAKHGADIMSRVGFAVAEQGRERLVGIVRKQLGGLIAELLCGHAAAAEAISGVVIVGNAVMHHLFCDLNLEPLSHFPFESPSLGMETFRASDLGWALPADPQVVFLPCLGGFVGSDILAGLLATRIPESESLVALVDLGTNAEIVVGTRERMLCASTAAGPAFEGAGISAGMRAATGAISEVRIENGTLHCHVLGNGPPRGICGSGLVDAAATGLELGLVLPSGRFSSGPTLPLTGPVGLIQTDIRQLQLAKGAIAAGLRILLLQWGATIDDLSRVYLAGAFGNYINRTSARRIGLLPFPTEKVVPSGNTALLGAKLALFALKEHGGAYPDLVKRVQHVSLHEDERFQEMYVEEMSFPAATIK